MAGLRRNKTSNWTEESWRKLRPKYNMENVIQKGGTVQNKNMGNIELDYIFPTGWQKKN